MNPTNPWGPGNRGSEPKRPPDNRPPTKPQDKPVEPPPQQKGPKR